MGGGSAGRRRDCGEFLPAIHPERAAGPFQFSAVDPPGATGSMSALRRSAVRPTDANARKRRLVMAIPGSGPGTAMTAVGVFRPLALLVGGPARRAYAGAQVPSVVREKAVVVIAPAVRHAVPTGARRPERRIDLLVLDRAAGVKMSGNIGDARQHRRGDARAADNQPSAIILVVDPNAGIGISLGRHVGAPR